MNNRAQRYLEKIHSHAYAYARFRPPLRVIAAVASRWGPGDHFQRVTSRGLSLSIITMGNAHFIQEGRHGSLGPGQVFLAHRGVPQRLETGAAGFMHKRSLIIEGEALEAVEGAVGLQGVDTIKPHRRSYVTGLFRQAYRLLHHKPAGFTTHLSLLAYELLLECGRSAAPDYPLAVRSATDFVRRNIYRRIRLDEIAQAAGTSIRHCTRLFDRHIGVAPMTYCINQKMVLAEHILTNTTATVKQAAAAVGYDDPFRFSLQYKQHFGVSPSHDRSRKAPRHG